MHHKIRQLLLLARSAVPIHSSKGVRILLFHEIEDSRMEAFAAVIRFIHERYGFISPDDYASAVSGDSLRYIVSFDDGFRSQMRAAREVLDPMGIKALFFLCPEFVDLDGEAAGRFVTERMQRNDIRDVPPALFPISRREASLLSTDGHVIGSHGRTHARMTELGGAEERAAEISASRDMLASISKRAVEWFAYPYGDITSIDASSLAVIGGSYRYCCSGVRGVNLPSTHRVCLRRENINPDDPVGQMCRIAAGGFDFLYRAKRNVLDAMAPSGEGYS